MTLDEHNRIVAWQNEQIETLQQMLTLNNQLLDAAARVSGDVLVQSVIASVKELDSLAEQCADESMAARLRFLSKRLEPAVFRLHGCADGVFGVPSGFVAIDVDEGVDDEN